MYVANLSVPTEDDEDKGAGVQKTAVTSGAVKPMVSVPQPGALAGGAATNGVNPLAPVTESNLAPAAAGSLNAGQAAELPTPTDAMADAAAADQKVQENLNKEREAQAEAAKKKAEIQARVVADQEKLDLKKGLLKPAEYQQIPYKKPTPSSPVEQWGSSAMLFAMLGSLFTRGHAVTAMNAAAAALNGFKQGDEAAAKQSFEEWKAASQNALQAANFQQRAFDAAMKNIDSEERLVELRGTKEEKEIDASTNALIATYQHENAALAKKQGGLPGLLRYLETEKKNSAEVAVNTKYLTTLQSPEYRALIAEGDQLGAAKMLAETGQKDAIAKYDSLVTSKREADRITREEIRDVRNSDEYKKADDIGKLELLATAGDEKSGAALAKHYATKAATVERFMKEPPKNSEESKLFDDEMLDYALYRSENKQPSPNSRNYESTKQQYNFINKYIRDHIDPKYDPSLFNRYRDAEKTWTTGKRSDMLLNQDTSAQHLAEYEGILKDIKDASVTKNEGWFNRATQTLRSATGNQDIKFESAKAIYEFVAAELIKSSAGTTALGDRMAAAAKLDPAQGLAALLPAVDELKSLQGHRLNSLYTQYKNSLPQGFKEAKPFASNFGPETIIEFGKYMDATPEQVQAAKDELAKRKGETPAAGATGGAAGGAAGGAVPEQQAIKAFGAYEPDKYEYGTNPNTGKFSRRLRAKVETP